MPRSQLRNPRKAVGVTRLNHNTSVDNRLTHASLLLGYLFDYGVDFQRRVINLTGEINEEMFNLIDAALSEMEAESKSTITVKINSPGGEVYQAMAIVGRLRQSKCNIVTVGYGTVMSAATLVLACGDKRKISQYSFFMHHEMGYELGETRHSEAKAYVAQADKEEKVWAKWMSEFTKKTQDFWLKNGSGVDAYFSAEQLLDLGVVDELF